jgi:hypothetical protein
MTIWTAAIVVSVCGAVGGFVNAFLAGTLHLPRRIGDTYTPGWIGNVAIGAVVALVFWSLRDPSSRVGIGESSHAILTLAEVAASLAAGIGAAHLLARERKRVVT